MSGPDTDDPQALAAGLNPLLVGTQPTYSQDPRYGGPGTVPQLVTIPPPPTPPNFPVPGEFGVSTTTGPDQTLPSFAGTTGAAIPVTITADSSNAPGGVPDGFTVQGGPGNFGTQAGMPRRPRWATPCPLTRLLAWPSTTAPETPLPGIPWSALLAVDVAPGTG